jgi:predicted ArsR family transcriptional regulator
MLRELLRLIVERGSASCADLAQALHVNPELARLALEELERRDYVRVIAADGATACERCPLRTSCLYQHAPRIWAVTSKGATIGREPAQLE